MKQYLLLTSALVAGGLLNSGVAEAACIKTPTCSSLGYESTTSCSGGLKCPFGNAWNCTFINKITELEKVIENIQKEEALANCKIGDILYSDMSCNTNVVASKTPIGVIFDVTNKLAIGLEKSQQLWSTEYFDVPGLSNITSLSAAIADWQGKNNTKVVLEYCKTKGKSCPAFEYVNSYKTEGTQAGDWYLPAMGELNAIYGNMDVLNVALGKIGGTTFGDYFYWSSSENSNNYAWRLNFYLGNEDYFDKDFRHSYVRPVLAF